MKHLSLVLAALLTLSLAPRRARADGFDISTIPEDAVVPSTATPTLGQDLSKQKKWQLDGKGINLFHNEYGSVSFSLYMLNRYINQLPAGQTYTDHLGNAQPVNPRNDIYAPQRVLLSFFGWVYDPRFNYAVVVWTVNAFDKVSVIGDL